MINESTDIQVTKHLDIYVTYVMNNGEIKTRFLQLLQLPAGDAHTISSLLIDLFEKKIDEIKIKYANKKQNKI